ILLRQMGKLGQALPLFQEVAREMEEGGFRHEHAARIVAGLIECHERLKQLDQAESWRRKLVGVVKEKSGADSLPYASELAALGENLLSQEKWKDAESALRDCVGVYERKAPESWKRFAVVAMLGAARLGQKEYADAEALLLAGYAGMTERE